MQNFQEPNEKNIQPGDNVFVVIPNPETATLEEIARDYSHVGTVKAVYHAPSGALRISVEGLEEKLGRDWTCQVYVKKTATPPPPAAPAAAVAAEIPAPPLALAASNGASILATQKVQPVTVPVFSESEEPLEVTSFQIKQAASRELTRKFTGEIKQTGNCRFSVHNFENDHRHVVKIKEIRKNVFQVSCDCRDFIHRQRVCKHIFEVFFQETPTAEAANLKLAA